MRRSEQEDREKTPARSGPRIQVVAFPFAVLFAYALVCLLRPADGRAALRSFYNVCRQILPALSIAFAVMVCVNLFVKPAHVKHLLGDAKRARGVALSTAGGILSMGPIYAWYPLLKELRSKGASDFHIANFLCCRAVKPPLLPLIVAYFGWAFTVVLTVFMVGGSLLTAFVVNRATRNRGD
jgi:uncharacterized membrane protein YraQ (UPF0718 family)